MFSNTSKVRTAAVYLQHTRLLSDLGKKIPCSFSVFSFWCLQKSFLIKRERICKSAHEIKENQIPKLTRPSSSTCNSPYLPSTTNTLKRTLLIRNVVIWNTLSWGCLVPKKPNMPTVTQHSELSTWDHQISLTVRNENGIIYSVYKIQNHFLYLGLHQVKWQERAQVLSIVGWGGRQ